jgi:hypothetical protein
VKRLSYILLLGIALMASCTHASYDTGDGEYSHLRTDYVNVEVKDQLIQSITTDDGTALNINPGFKVITNPKDTTLRWLLYYNKVNNSDPIEIVSHSNMTLLKVKDASEVEMKTDPVTVNSVWVGKDRKYLNLNIGLKMGTTESENNLHFVGMVCTKTEDGITYYTFYHDQADIPQYYTQNVLLTVDCAKEKIIDLTINTYNGTWHKQFIVYS